MILQALAELTDADLLARVQVLALDERRATATLVAHLAEVENRRLYLRQACASMFVYCTRVLHLSEHAAYNRIEAARAARRFPAVLASLEQGLVNLTAIRLLAPVLTGENHRELLTEATHKSKREVEELVARLRPQADVQAQVRKLPASKPPTPQPAAESKAANEETRGHASAPETSTPAPAAADTDAPFPTPARAIRPATVPLAPERYKVQLTINAATCERLRRAQELLRHRIPDGDVAEVIDLALDLLVRDLEKRKFAAVQRPRTGGAEEGRRSNGVALGSQRSAPASNSPGPARHISARVRRAVWERDRGCCAFVGENGARCGERGGLEFDHIRPHADGGEATVNNVRLLCRSHNQYESQQFFGLWQAESASENTLARG